MRLNKTLLYPVGISDSCRYASECLERAGISLTDHPSPEITHLLLDVPCLQEDSKLKGLLRMLPATVTVIGGRLEPEFLDGYQKIDLLSDPFYLARNAAITAECAVRLAAPYLKTICADSPALILGWGRIGKCLARLLAAMGCPVTVAARKETDRAMLEALGYRAVEFSRIPDALRDCRILFNTVPELTLHSSPDLWKNILAFDLASEPGLKGNTFIPARGLPGKYAPESSGRLIAETICRII